jgi:putative transposon-encoded protein
VCEVEKRQNKVKMGHRLTRKGRVKFVVYGEEMLEKKVSVSGNSGRIYLPPDWVDCHVKIIRIN